MKLILSTHNITLTKAIEDYQAKQKAGGKN